MRPLFDLAALRLIRARDDREIDRHLQGLPGLLAHRDVVRRAVGVAWLRVHVPSLRIETFDEDAVAPGPEDRIRPQLTEVEPVASRVVRPHARVDHQSALGRGADLYRE